MSNSTQLSKQPLKQTALTSPVANDTIIHAFAGAGGGMLSMMLTYPLITLSTRAQVDSFTHSDDNDDTTVTPNVNNADINPTSQNLPSNTSLLHSIKHSTTPVHSRFPYISTAAHIIKQDGPSGLYAGLSSALVGISVTNFTYYYCYEWLRSKLADSSTTSMTTLQSLVTGAVAGSASVFVTNPIWVVNTRMMVNQRQNCAKPSAYSTLCDIIHNEGATRLFSGVRAALILVINPILQYTIFEQLRKFLLQRRAQKSLPSTIITPTDAFFLGAIGKLIATSLTYPYITLKSNQHVATSTSSCIMPTTLFDVLRQKNLRQLYAGILPKLIQSVLTAAFLFAFKDWLYKTARNFLSLPRHPTLPK